MPGKVDFKRTLPSYRALKGSFEVIEVPEFQYLMIDGHGDPNTEPYVEALQSLYPVAYKLKFTSKRELGRDYVVPPLEGLWWADDMRVFTSARDKTQWDWTMMILAPEWVNDRMFASAVEQAGVKNRPSRLEDVRLESLAEGLCVQTLHVGAFDDEADLLAEMHEEFIPSRGLTLTGKHHEIYFGDPRRTSPEKLRTILRQPVARAPKHCTASPQRG